MVTVKEAGTTVAIPVAGTVCSGLVRLRAESESATLISSNVRKPIVEKQNNHKTLISSGVRQKYLYLVIALNCCCFWLFVLSCNVTVYT